MTIVRLTLCFLVLAASGVPVMAGRSATTTATAPAREQLIKIVTAIQRADYEGNLVDLKRLFEELTPFLDKQDLASRVRYWRGFALWRRALNGFNDSLDPKEIEADLEQGVNEFDRAGALDPRFEDAKIGALSCISNLIFLNQRNPARMQELIAQAIPLRKDAQALDPDNPRLLWVMGPNLWYAPPERGGGQAKAIEIYQKALDAKRAKIVSTSDPLEPSWGEPELLMNLAWSNLHKITPDLPAAEHFAHEALDIVPYWHYVRDILLPQIEEAEKNEKTKVAG
jgi:hypothetical protein